MTDLVDRSLDFERCYRALASRDERFDGWFVVAVRTTGIYCRPSCPAITPRRSNVEFLRTAAAAQRTGYRACKRCRPDASPGSPEWSCRSDVVARAMRLIADGVVDRDGVGGLAARLGYSRRQLQRQFVAELGAGPLAVARAHRAQTARVLIESTALPFAQVAHAAGFGSTRQFNTTVHEVFAATPRELRRRRRIGREATPGELTLHLPARAPFAAGEVLAFLGARAVDGVEHYADGVYRRTLRLPRGAATATLRAAAAGLQCDLRLQDLRDLGPAVQRCRRLVDADADTVGIAAALRDDPHIGPLVAALPGRRVPGTVDGSELAVRAVLGQQVSIAAARKLTSALVAASDEPTRASGRPLLFPSPAAIAEAAGRLRMPRARREALEHLVTALEAGDLYLDAGADAHEAVAALRRIRGIGPWTAGYVAMRGLAHPDAYPGGDAAVRRALRLRGLSRLDELRVANRWRPWRAYAVMHLWAAAAEPRGAAYARRSTDVDVDANPATKLDLARSQDGVRP